MKLVWQINNRQSYAKSPLFVAFPLLCSNKRSNLLSKPEAAVLAAEIISNRMEGGRVPLLNFFTFRMFPALLTATTTLESTQRSSANEASMTNLCPIYVSLQIT